MDDTQAGRTGGRGGRKKDGNGKKKHERKMNTDTREGMNLIQKGGTGR